MNDFEFAKFAFEHNHPIQFILSADKKYTLICLKNCNTCKIKKEHQAECPNYEKININQYKKLIDEFPEYFI